MILDDYRLFSQIEKKFIDVLIVGIIIRMAPKKKEPNAKQNTKQAAPNAPRLIPT